MGHPALPSTGIAVGEADAICGEVGIELAGDLRVDIQEADPYFADLRRQFSEGMLDLFARLPNPDWIAGDAFADA